MTARAQNPQPRSSCWVSSPSQDRHRTVQGDLHDIGKSLVGMMLKARLRVIDWVSMSLRAFCRSGAQRRADHPLSALLTYDEKRGRDRRAGRGACAINVRVMMRRRAVTQYYADEIGADGIT